MSVRSVVVLPVVVLGVALLASSAVAQKKYDPGASDTEIKIGESAPFSGPQSQIGQIAKSEIAYFKMIDEQGGINGRKVRPDRGR